VLSYIDNQIKWRVIEMISWIPLFLVLLFLVAIPILIYKIVYRMSSEEVEKIFCSVRPGDAAIIVAGPNATQGVYVKTLLNYIGHSLDENEDIVKAKSSSRGLWQSLFPGVFLMGVFPPGAYHKMLYKFDFAELDDQGKIVFRRIETSRVMVKRTLYALSIIDFETGSSVPIGFVLALSVEIRNPRKAVIENDQWYVLVTNLIKGAARQIVSDIPDPETANKLVSQGLKDRNGKKIDSLGDYFLDKLKTMQKDGVAIWDIILEEYGVWIGGVDLTSLDLGAWAEAARKLIMAEREGQAEKRRRQLEGEAFVAYKVEEIKAYKLFIEDLGKDLTMFAQYVNVLNTAGQSGKAIFAEIPPGIANLKQLLGEA
jgi:hypothetical protein